jgi:hypothetical protein
MRLSRDLGTGQTAEGAPVTRRTNSKLLALIKLVPARPIVNAALIAREPKITPRAAQMLVAEQCA